MPQNLKKGYIEFSLVEALFFAIFSITSYQTVFLQETGLTSSQIGLIVSASALVGLIAVPIWGMISDYLHTARKTFLVSIVVTSLMYGILPIVGNFANGRIKVFFIYIPLIFLFRQASNSMLDSWCISELAPKGIRYGSVRMWGSVGYSVSSIVLGVLVGTCFDVDFAFYLILPLIVLLLKISPKEEKIAKKSERIPAKKRERALAENVESAPAKTGERILAEYVEMVPAKNGEKISTENNKILSQGTARKHNYFISLLRNNTFMVYIIYSAGLNIYLAVTLIFMPYILLGANCKAGQMGLVTGIRALIEISTMYLGSQLIQKVPFRYIMIIPGILFGFEHLFYQYATNLYGILAIMVLSGAAGGIFYSLGPSYIYEIVPGEVRNTAQSLNAMNMTIISIVGSLIGGYVINIWGIHALTTGCGILILILTVFFILTLTGINHLKAND